MTISDPHPSTRLSNPSDASMSIRFSTENLPAHQRLPVWRDVHARQWLSADFTPSDEAPFRCEANIRVLPGLRIASITSSGGRGTRTRELIARCDADEVVFTVATHHQVHLTWRGRETSKVDGEATLMPTDEPGSIGMPRPGSILMYGVPVSLLKPLVPNVGDRLFRCIPRTSDALRLLLGYTRLVLGSEGGAAPQLQQAAAAHLRDLIALALGTTRDGGALAEEGGLRAARLQAIKAEVAREAASPELNIDRIAQRHRLSPRSIQLLFEAEGLTFSQFVLEQRLMLAHRALSSWHGPRRSITDIALDSGFSNVSYFNRAFRQRFGASPTELRARHVN